MTDADIESSSPVTSPTTRVQSGTIAMAGADIDAVLARAKELRAAEQHQEAIDVLTTAIQSSPHAKLYFSRGRTFDFCDQDEKAVADYTKAIELDPTKAAYYYHRGSALAYPLGQDEEAIDDFEKALELDPDNASAHQSCALSYLLVGPISKALEHAEAAVRLTPANDTSHFCLGQAFVSLKRDRDAITSFLHAVNLDPNQAHYWSALAGAYERVDDEGNQELALAAITKAIEFDQTSAGYFNMRGRLFLKMRRAAEAIADLQHALTLNPDETRRMLIDASLEEAQRLPQ
jgi:tetratricopeptide (TPR) repeat protein